MSGCRNEKQYILLRNIYARQAKNFINIVMNIGINVITSNKTLRGTDRYALETLKSLAEIDKRNNYFIFHAHWQKYIGIPKCENFHSIRLAPPPGIASKALWNAFQFPEVTKKYKLDLIHYTNPIPLVRKERPVIVTIHDLAEFFIPAKYGIFKSRAKRFSVRLSIKKADYILAVSESTKRGIIDLFDSDPDSIGVTLEGPPKASAFHISDLDYIHSKYGFGKKYILYVGVMERTKKIDAIIRAFSRLSEPLKNSYNVVIVGNKGNASKEVEKAVQEEGLHNKVFFPGHVSEEDLYCIYKKASLFVFPSLVEGFGLPVLEAMRYGAPVVASNSFSIPEVAGDAAMLVDPRNVNELTDAISAVLTDNGLRKRLIDKGLKRVSQFSWTKTAEKTLAMYKMAGSLI